MVRLTDSVVVAADLDRCFAFLTAPPVPPPAVVLGLGGQRVEYRDTTLEVVSADAERHRVVLWAGDGEGRVRATIAAALRPGATGAGGTTVDLVTDLDVTGAGADVARALLPAAARRVLTGLASTVPTPTPTPTPTPVPEPPAAVHPAPTRRRGALLAAAAAAVAAAVTATVALRRRRR